MTYGRQLIVCFIKEQISGVRLRTNVTLPFARTALCGWLVGNLARDSSTALGMTGIRVYRREGVVLPVRRRWADPLSIWRTNGGLLFDTLKNNNWMKRHVASWIAPTGGFVNIEIATSLRSSQWHMGDSRLFDTLKNNNRVCAFAPWIAPTNRVTNDN